MEGRPFGRYRLIELLGHGGMGEVWRAYDTATQRVVALKVLRSHLANDPHFEQRFRREAFAAASLADPHVVPIHAFGEIDGQLYVDMRLIEGRDLHGILQHGPLEAARAVKIVDQVASALHAAHRVGLLHRDVKPSNILVAEDDFAYLIDFGIARGAGDAGLTGIGQVIGTVAYLAPERLAGGRDDARADIYALACVLYECLTGAPPFRGSTLEQQIAAQLSTSPTRPSSLRPELPAALDTVVATGLAKDPQQRYSTTRELAEAAQAALSARSPGPRQQMPSVPHFAPALGALTDPPTVRRSSPVAAFLPQPQPAGEPEPKPARASRRPLVIAGAVVLIIAVGIVAFIASRGDGDPAPAAAVSPAPALLQNTGPFTGRYTADFGPQTDTAGKPFDGATPASETWDVRSTCADGRCVATASRSQGSTSLADLVFDQVGGAWVAVGIEPSTCGDKPGDQFKSFTLRPQPDGRLIGDFVVEATVGCFDTASVTFTRTGDADVAKLPDPTAQAARVVSPAEALHGQYHVRREFAGGAATKEYDYGVQTHCLRAGNRCMSLFHNPDSIEALVFENTMWTMNEDWDVDSPKCGPNHLKVTATFPLPEPPQNPISDLSGHGFWDQSSDRCRSMDFTQSYQRTGD